MTATRDYGWILGAVLGLVSGLGCGGGGSTSTGTSGTGEVTESSGGSSSTRGGSSTTGAPTTGAPTTGEPTTGAPTGTGSSSSGGEGYCDFNEGAQVPFLKLNSVKGPLDEGATWPLECGGQGLWMFGIYPVVGGWDPMSMNITFSVVVDVEGFNTNPAGHFFSGPVGYYIGCEDLIGGVTGVVPVLPPDDLVDLAALDGLPATVHVEIDGGGTALVVDTTVILSAPKELVDLGCEMGI